MPGQVGQGPSGITLPPRLTFRQQHSLSPGQAGVTPHTPPTGLSHQARTGVSTNTDADSMKFRNRGIMKDFFPTRVGQIHTSGEKQQFKINRPNKARVEHAGCASALSLASGMRLVYGPQPEPSGDWWTGDHICHWTALLAPSVPHRCQSSQTVWCVFNTFSAAGVIRHKR